MLFNSYLFLFLFLPLCLLGFVILRKKQATLAKVWLTCFSLWFYGYFNPSYLLLMLGSIAGNYGIHRLMVQSLKKQRKGVDKTILFLGVSGNLALLFYFKYFDFFISNINKLWDSGLTVRGILLPLGISFFTFQQISFLADTYKGELEKCSFVDYALFVSFFPQLIAGPIVTQKEMLPQFQNLGKKTKEGYGELAVRGIYVFVLGLAKKVLIADTLGKAVDFAYGNVAGLNGLESLLVVLCYSLQLYFDFSGYCDMAKGLAEMFGMQIANNFNSPYKAINIIDFWKRWHITLSHFFTKNIYIPLGGNRKGRIRTYCNLFLVFFLSGIWHGAGWNFIFWGILHGILYMITKIYLDWKSGKERRNQTKEEKRKEEIGLEKGLSLLKKILGRILTFSYVSIAWVYFRASTLGQANSLLKNVWKKTWQLPSETFLDFFNLGEFWYPMKVLQITNLPYARSYLMIGFLVFSLGIVFFGKNTEKLKQEFTPKIGNACSSAILFIWCVVSLSGVSTFLYFNF